MLHICAASQIDQSATVGVRVVSATWPDSAGKAPQQPSPARLHSALI